ncbi:unnamed protein product [Prorocentrum cordatum]|uniref:Uncharacterized protein n=1 Tax=Prorocentrum cordatum TaxID=2364126 RepID=A0ABN9QDG6_9DINO|nr:unnamed protein product [Polarella glacialis]
MFFEETVLEARRLDPRRSQSDSRASYSRPPATAPHPFQEVKEGQGGRLRDEGGERLPVVGGMACSALPLRSRQRLEQGRRLNIRLLLQEALKTGTSTGTGELVLLLTSGPAILLRSKREWRGYASRGKRHCASKAEHLHQLLLAIATKIEGKKPTPTTTTPTIEAV